MAMRSRGMAVFGAALGVVVLSVDPVRADAIDGDWCFGAQHLNIRGPSIRTPGGTQMSGTYDRHNFFYLAPPGEADAGSEVSMRLNSDEMMTLVRKLGSTSGQAETWRRCKPVS